MDGGSTWTTPGIIDQNSIFECRTGISSGSTQSIRITNNSIQNSSIFDPSFGIKLESVTAARVLSNTVGQYQVGLQCAYCQSSEILQNTFTANKIGINFTKPNPATNVECNLFTNSLFLDISINFFEPLGNLALTPLFGNTNKAANNVVSSNTANLVSSTSNVVNYFYDQTFTGNPVVSPPNLVKMRKADPNNCHIPSAKNKPNNQDYTKLQQFENEWKQLVSEYEKGFDFYRQSVVQQNLDDTQSMSLLLDSSPLLGRNLLISVVNNKATPLSDSALHHLIMANSPLAYPILDNIKVKIDLLDPLLVQDILSAQSGLSDLEKHELKMARAYQKYMNLAYDMANWYLKNNQPDSAYALMKKTWEFKIPTEPKEQIGCYKCPNYDIEVPVIGKTSFSDTLSATIELDGLILTSDRDSASYDIQALSLQYYKQNRHYGRRTAQEDSLVVGLSERPNPARNRARNLEFFWKGIDKRDPLNLPNPNSAMKKAPEKIEEKIQVLEMQIQPVPASTQVKFIFPAETGTLKVYNLQGQLVFEKNIQSPEFTWERNQLPDGVYLVEFQSKHIKSSGKMIWQK